MHVGTNSKASHASYVVAPTAAGKDASEVNPAEDQVTDASVVEVDLAVVIANNGFDLEGDLGAMPVIDVPDDPGEHYTMLAGAVADAQLAMADADGQEQLEAKLHHAGVNFLNGLTPEQLQQLAKEKGFEYPGLVGLSGAAQHPLVHWLDPSYPDELESKKKIQAVALDRYALLCAGGTVAGKTLAQWQAIDPTLGPAAGATPGGFSSWQATAADVVSAQAAIAQAVTALKPNNLYGYATCSAEDFHSLIEAENKLATAHNAELSAELTQAVAAARSQIDKALTHVNSPAIAQAVDAAKQSGLLSDAHGQVLNAAQLTKLLRASTPADERDSLEALAAERATVISAAQKAATNFTAVLDSNGGTIPNLDTTDNNTAAEALIYGCKAFATNQGKMHSWGAVHEKTQMDAAGVHTKTATQIAQWASGQSLTGLRAFVANFEPGKYATVATKSQLGKYLAAMAINDYESAAQLEKKLIAKYDVKHNPAAVPPAKLKTLNQPKSQGVVASSAGKSSFSQKHAEMMAALRHATSAYAAVPQHLDPAKVSTFDFGPGKTAALGGTHPKTLHTGPDGKTWMAKREGTPRGGAVTHAEAAASQLLRRAGLPAVPVYATKIAGKPASVQPLLTGATEMPSSPSTWSQADVDAVVRLHVASWAMGNHDAHHGNVLRTPDGGLVPVDQGQAFKNFGRDQLGLHYRPSTTAIYHQAYDAHVAGNLPKGVRINPAAAHPVIKQLESIPDAEWRAMLHTTAHTGAAQPKMKWVPPMRARAAKKHGIAEGAVTTSQIAETFLDHAVERKNGLRSDFVKFFTSDLKLTAAAALQHIGKS